MVRHNLESWPGGMPPGDAFVGETPEEYENRMAETNQYARPALQGRRNDVTPKQEELLVRLMEECAELQVECAKILRWGWKSFNPDNVGRGTNEENFHREAGDVGKMYDQLSRLRNPSLTK